MTEERTENTETMEEAQAPEAEHTHEEDQETATGDVYSLMQWMIIMLTESAWQWLGLHKNAVTGKVEKDLTQAKVAIDSVVFLSDQVMPHVSEDQRRAYRQAISDLRVNFVQQLNQQA